MTEVYSICADLCGFVRTNILANGVEFDENTPFTKVGIDSLSLVQILLFVERQYGLSIPETHLVEENMKSTSALSSCLYELLMARDSEKKSLEM